MTLQLSKGRPYKAYIKKLENGFGVKTINTLTGVENIIIITADSIKASRSNKRVEDSQCQFLAPLLSKFSQETVSATLSIPSTNEPSPNLAINKVLAHLEPHLREVVSDINGFHIFDESETKSSPNIQKTSVIIVTNTELARIKGVHFNVPGKLMNMFLVDGQTKEGRIKFEADSVVKPLTIVVSDYVLHINICYDLPSKQTKTVGTQTKKRYVLSSSIDDSVPVYKIESFLLSDLQVKPEQKCTQTDSSIFVEESKLSQTNLQEHYQDNDIQTVFFKEQTSYATMSSADKRFYSVENKSDQNTDEGNTKTDSFEYSSKQTIDFESSLDSLISYDSHPHLYQATVLDHIQDGEVHKRTSVENKEVTRNIQESISTDEKIEKTMLTLFDNGSNYSTKMTNSASKNVELNYLNHSTAISTKSAGFEEDQSEISVKTANSDNGLTQVRNAESSSNVSIKDIKERLNKTTLSLQQLYSVIELMEKTNVNNERTFQTTGYSERGEIKNKTDVSRQSSINMTSPATLKESTSNISSDQSVSLLEKRLRSNQVKNTHDYDKKLNKFNSTSSLDILCEHCGSFHTDVGFKGHCRMFSEKNIELSEDKDCRGAINSCSSTGKENVTKDVSEADFLQDEMKSCENRNLFNKEMQSHFRTTLKDSTEHNYLTMNELRNFNKEHKGTRFLDADKKYVDKSALFKTAEDQKMIDYPKESNERLEEHDCTHTLQENKNIHRSDIEKSLENPINRNQFQPSGTLVFDCDSTVIERGIKVDNPSSQTLTQSKETSIDTISQSRNSTSDENIETNTVSDNSNQNLSSSHHASDENDKDCSKSSISSKKNIELENDNEEIEQYNAVKNLQVSNSDSFISQPNNFICTKKEKSLNVITSRNEKKIEAKTNGKILYFTEVRNTKSWISFKKSVQSCNFNEKLGLKGKITNSEPITKQLKTKNLSSGDHLGEDKSCKTSSDLQEKLDTIGIFNNKSNFLNNKHSSSSTLHIIPSSQELLILHSQESSFQGKQLPNNGLEKVNGKLQSFEKRCAKSRQNCNNTEDGNLAYNTKYSRYVKFEDKVVANKADLKTCDSLKTAKLITKNKYPENKQPNSKLKKSKLFCFLM